MRRILSALIFAGACLCMQACDKPCPPGYAKAGVKCKPLPAAGELDAGDAGSNVMNDGGEATPSKDAGDPGPVDGETCDGADNDDDGAIDESFACVQTANTVCTTTCGSSGMGQCSEKCELPSVSACVAPAEQCDGIDQDCDGIADNGFAYSTLGYQVWTQTEFATDTTPSFGNVALLKRQGGGAWMLYRASDPSGVEHDLIARRLDASGSYLGSAATPTKPGGAVAWDGTTSWASDSDSKWIAILARIVPSSPPSSTKKLVVQLYNSSDFSFVGEIDLASVSGDVDFLPQDVAVFEDSLGNVRALAVYTLRQANGDQATHYAVVTRDPAGAFLQTTRTLLSKFLHAGLVAAAKIPCREEWLLGYAAVIDNVSYRDLRRVSIAAEFLGAPVDTLPDSLSLNGLSSGETHCDAADPQMLTAYAHSEGVRARVWSVNRATGAFSSVGPDIELNLGSVSATQAGGRWFVAGVGREASAPARAREIDVATSNASERIKEITLFVSGAGANPGNLAGGFGAGFASASRTAVVHSGSGLVVAFPNGFGDPTNLDLMRSPALPNSTAPAVAVTYRVGCP